MSRVFGKRRALIGKWFLLVLAICWPSRCTYLYPFHAHLFFFHSPQVVLTGINTCVRSTYFTPSDGTPDPLHTQQSRHALTPSNAKALADRAAGISASQAAQRPPARALLVCSSVANEEQGVSPHLRLIFETITSAAQAFSADIGTVWSQSTSNGRSNPPQKETFRLYGVLFRPFEVVRDHQGLQDVRSERQSALSSMLERPFGE